MHIVINIMIYQLLILIIIYWIFSCIVSFNMSSTMLTEVKYNYMIHKIEKVNLKCFVILYGCKTFNNAWSSSSWGLWESVCIGYGSRAGPVMGAGLARLLEPGWPGYGSRAGPVMGAGLHGSRASWEPGFIGAGLHGSRELARLPGLINKFV
jgi:hypothetical protein